MKAWVVAALIASCHPPVPLAVVEGEGEAAETFDAFPGCDAATLEACEGPAPDATGGLKCFLGDSITVGTGGATPYPTTVCAELDDGSTCLNLGVSGQQIDGEICSRYCADVIGNACPVLAAMGATNDFRADKSAAQVFASFEPMLDDAYRRGIRVLVIATTPSGLTPEREAQRTILNENLSTWVDAHPLATFVDVNGILDADSDGELDSAPTDYNDDGIHPTAAGYNLIGVGAAAAL